MIKKSICALIFPLIILLNTRLAFAVSLIPGGESIGIVVEYDGVIISGNYDFEVNGTMVNPKNNDINVGDIIVQVNGVTVKNSETLIQEISASLSANKEIILTIDRNGVMITRTLSVYLDTETNNFKTGLYVKDSLSGIGTVTFYDPSSSTYGALGHKMTDSTMDIDVSFNTGQVFESYVVSVTRSQDNNPGEKIATIDKYALLGTISINSEYGVYGTYSSLSKDNTYTIESATIDEVELGAATILTVIEGTTVESFDIEITELKRQSQPETKGIVFKITDERLLDATNGIVQGMSGSPIIQNNKLVGSVTHVVLSDVDYGYGLFIEWMLEENMRQ